MSIPKPAVDPIPVNSLSYQVGVHYQIGSSYPAAYTPWALSVEQWNEADPAIAVAQGIVDAARPGTLEVVVLYGWQVVWAFVQQQQPPRGRHS